MEGTIGEIRMFGGTFAPRNWAICSGQLMSIAQNNALFSILGTTYGGDGRTTFGLPDLRGRIPMGVGNGPGLSPHHLGQKGGVEDVTLNQTQIPAHNHFANQSTAPNFTGTMNISTATADEDEGDDSYIAAPSSPIFTTTAPDTTLATGAVTGTIAGGSITVSNTGGNLDHTNIQPFTCINFIICLFGVYPSRS